MNAQLTFNQVSFDTVSNPHDTQQIWITASDLATALGYKKADAVNQVYNRNADEFTNKMTLTLKLSVKGFGNGSSEKEVRIFSLRGCHLIAMFAKTAVAKAFRKWVLDLIESEANRHHMLTTADERTGLRQAADALVGKYGLLYPDAYRLVHQRFNVTSIDELTIEQVAQATEYLHKLLLSGKGMTLPAIEFPIRFIDKTNAKNGNGRMGIKELNQMYESRDIPLNILMFSLEKQGYDTSACRDEYNLLRNLVRSAFDKLEFMASYLSDSCYSKARLPSDGGQLSLT